MDIFLTDADISLMLRYIFFLLLTKEIFIRTKDLNSYTRRVVLVKTVLSSHVKQGRARAQVAEVKL